MAPRTRADSDADVEGAREICRWRRPLCVRYRKCRSRRASSRARPTGGSVTRPGRLS